MDKNKTVQYIPIWEAGDKSIGRGWSYDTFDEVKKYFVNRNIRNEKEGIEDTWQKVEVITTEILDLDDLVILNLDNLV